MTDFSSLEPFSPAETRLITQCSNGGRVVFGDGELPETETPEVTVRAALLRALLLGKRDSLPEKGLRLRGVWISGTLDLQGAECGLDLSFTECHLEEPLELVNARLRSLYFNESVLAGISADNAELDGSLYIRAGSTVTGEISLSGAQIKGDLQLCDIELQTKARDAVFAPALRVGGSVFLGNYPYAGEVTTLVANGSLFLSSIYVENDLFITNCSMAPAREILGDPVFMATEEHGRDIALSLARARVGGILYFKDNQIAQGIVNLAGAKVARLRDELAAPGAYYPIRLDGFTYDDFSRHAETSLKARLDWLARRPEDTPFTAQPYEHLARVLMHIGHRRDARTVLMEKEKLQRAENRRLIAEAYGVGGRWILAWLSDALMRFGVGYGYRPSRVLLLAVALIVGLGLFFQATWNAGDMTPNAAPVLVSHDWIAATESHPENPGAFWSSAGQPGQDWETFNGFAYAADLVIPIVSLGQESTWAPSTSRSELGRVGWWLRWFAKALGWVVTALGAAAVTGAVRQD